MNDPEVVSLVYELVLPDWLHFAEDALPWEGKLGDFKGRLSHLELVLRPTSRFPDADSARAVVEPLLRGWEAAYELEHSRTIEFRFANAEVVDRKPNRVEGMVGLSAVAAGRGFASGTLTVTVMAASYPSPPTPALIETPLGRLLRLRWRSTREGSHSLALAQAYAVLTEVEHRFGGRRAAAEALRISRAVLSKLGALTAEGGPEERRKATKRPQKPLTADEWLWINTAIPRIIRRVLEVENRVPDLQSLDMSDLRWPATDSGSPT